MKFKKHLPNLITLANLFCGTVATLFAVQGEFEQTAFFVVLGIVFDFFDGFVARILNVSGELGKQLDSLADVVTSGVVPGIVMFQLMLRQNFITGSNPQHSSAFYEFNVNNNSILPFFGLLLTLGACYRLAKFNLDTRQSDAFIGLPTPAMSLFVVFLPLIQMHTEIEFVQDIIRNHYFLIGITIVFSFLMNAEVLLFSLKFKQFNVKKDALKIAFLLLSAILLITVQYLAIPLIILLYVVLSFGMNLFQKKT